VGLLGLCLALAGGTAQAALKQVWPVTGGMPERLGYTPLRLPERPEIAWQIDLPGAGIFDSSPVVDERHRTYVCTNVDIGSTARANLYCLARDGNIVWQVQLGSTVACEPILLADGKVVVYDSTKRLTAFSPAGEQLWSRQLTRTASTNSAAFWTDYQSGQAVATYLQPVPDADGGLCVLDDAQTLYRIGGDGSSRWFVSVAGTGTGGLTIGAGRVFVPASDGWLRSFALRDGLDLGALALGGQAPTFASCVPEQFVFLPVHSVRGPYFRALALGQAPAFDFDLGANVYAPASLATTGDVIFAVGDPGTTDNSTLTSGKVVALTAAGKFSWSKDLHAIPAGTIVIGAGGRICFGTLALGEMGVYCLSPQHAVDWWIPVRGSAVVMPIDENLLGVAVITSSLPVKPDGIPMGPPQQTTIMAIGR
jgi:hypothetical protein